MAEATVNKQRRYLLGMTCAAGGVAALAVATPFFLSMFPSARARAAGAPVQVDVSKVEQGMMIRAEWRSKPVWILHRTPEMLKSLSDLNPKVADPRSASPMQPDYAQNEYRSVKPEWLVVVGICTHLGCSPTDKLQAGADSGMGDDWKGGFYCPCHGSKFDLAGRVFRDMPAPTNLEVPKYQFVSETQLVIGDDGKGA